MGILQQSHGISGDVTTAGEPDLLDLDDIQHFLMARPPALAARYEFLTFRACEGRTRAWLAGLIDKVGNVKGSGVQHAGLQMGDDWVDVEWPQGPRRG